MELDAGRVESRPQAIGLRDLLAPVLGHFEPREGAGHTAEAVWVQPVADLWSLAPSLRYHSQGAARFYCDPSTDPTVFPACPGTPVYSTTDHRMSAFGAFTLGLKLAVHLHDWTGDLKYERYTQKSDWRLGGKGSPGLDTLHADIVQVGVSKAF